MATDSTRQRRRFLGLVATGGAGAAAALAVRGNAAGTEAQPQDAEPRASGYRVTDHVLKYYKTTEA